jgi:hypothetical protein
MDRKINFQFNDMTGKKFTFETLNHLLSFLKTEINYWQDQKKLVVNSNKIHPAFNSYSTLNNAVATIENWPQEQFEKWNDQQLQKQINQMVPQIFSIMQDNWMWSGHPFVGTFINCHKDHGKAASDAFLKYISKNQVENINNFDIFIGVMKAYEYKYQDSEILNRRKSENLSFEHLRNQLVETNNTLFKEVAEFKNEFDTWDKDSRKNWSSWIEKTSEEYTEQQNKYNVDNAEQQNKHINEFVTFMNDCRNKMKEQEDLYHEKLRLEAPAQYWNKAAEKFKTQGWIWARSLVLLTLLGLIGLSVFYVSWLKGQEMKIELGTVKGIIIFGTILAVYAYLIRVFSKLIFSSFHLMRDAEEREQLTYLYLSLINKNAIDTGSRDIVLQSLFSRTDTGLLGSDSGPTMPAGINEFLKSFCQK